MLVSSPGNATSAGATGGGSSRQTYQSRNGESGPVRADWNHGCSTEVWLGTRSAITRMPRSCAVRRKLDEVAEAAQPRVDAVEVGDVVAVVRSGLG